MAVPYFFTSSRMNWQRSTLSNLLQHHGTAKPSSTGDSHTPTDQKRAVYLRLENIPSIHSHCIQEIQCLACDMWIRKYHKCSHSAYKVEETIHILCKRIFVTIVTLHFGVADGLIKSDQCLHLINMGNTVRPD